MLEVIRSLGCALEEDRVDLPFPLCPLYPGHGEGSHFFTIPLPIALLSTRDS